MKEWRGQGQGEWLALVCSGGGTKSVGWKGVKAALLKQLQVSLLVL